MKIVNIDGENVHVFWTAWEISMASTRKMWLTLILKVTTRQCFNTAQKMKFSIKDLFSKCDLMSMKLQIWSHLLKKSLMENFVASPNSRFMVKWFDLWGTHIYQFITNNHPSLKLWQIENWLNQQNVSKCYELDYL